MIRKKIFGVYKEKMDRREDKDNRKIMFEIIVHRKK